MRRLVLVVTALLLLTACIGDTMNDKDQDDSTPSPTARSQSDGVEVWDLRVSPSAAAFGIPDDSNAGIYESEEPRSVRFELPQGRTLTMEATLVSFHRSGEGDAARFTVGMRSDQVPPAAIVTTYRDVLEQLDLGPETVDELDREIAAAPDDQTERISVASPELTLDDLKLGAQAGLAPVARSGRVIVGGSWQQR